MVANGEGGDGRRIEVRCLAWRSGEEQVACVRLPAAVDGTADEALEVARDELRLRSGGLHATPVRALLGVAPVGSPAADASVAVEVITTAGLRKVQVGWAGFPSPFGEGRPGRSRRTRRPDRHERGRRGRVAVLLPRLPAGPAAHRRSLQAWPTWLGGVRALAVDGGRVLLYGGYRDQANRCLLFDLDETTLANPRPGRLALPGGPPLRPGFLVGRGPSLHAIDATGWYRLDLRQIGGHP